MNETLFADLLALRALLELAWSADTASGEWRPDRPSTGQCAVTAMIVQDRFGGELLRTTNGGASHYWNLLPGDIEVDLTRDQFPVWSPDEVTVRPRSYVEGHPETVARYERLTSTLGAGARA